MKLIDKAALVAEIERRFKEHDSKKRDYASTDHFWRAIEDKDILSFINTLEVKDLPMWERVSPDTGQTTLYKDEDKSYLERFGYRIDLNELDKLPKKNLKAQEGE